MFSGLFVSLGFYKIVVKFKIFVQKKPLNRMLFTSI